MPLLDVENLRTHFHTRDGTVRAVDGILGVRGFELVSEQMTFLDG